MLTHFILQYQHVIIPCQQLIFINIIHLKSLSSQGAVKLTEGDTSFPESYFLLKSQNLLTTTNTVSCFPCWFIFGKNVCQFSHLNNRSLSVILPSKNVSLKKS